jgi:Transposase DDE domain
MHKSRFGPCRKAPSECARSPIFAALDAVSSATRLTLSTKPVLANDRYDVHEFIDLTRELGTTPHIAQNLARPGGSAIDGRTTRHVGYAMSQQARPRIEPAFGWLKTIAWIRKAKLRGLANVDWLFVFASAAFNLIRLPKLLQPA